MCNVAALTVYATIYEDIGCICNKYIEKACTWYCKFCCFNAVLFNLFFIIVVEYYFPCHQIGSFVYMALMHLSFVTFLT